ncbi:LPXTG cell wall anchor domain-containing protein [Luteococcus sp. H138]|uniref:LPXTG cell wall anchor domain-containing protein n=1 Tax=unclassified Luteococcus TaxID=2639923 RepID=UPI00313C0649
MNTTPSTRTIKPLDIRALIGAMLAIIGLILTAMGLFADPELAKTGGVNANLIAGIVLLVSGGLFLLRARMTPLKLREVHVD